jgi:soluble lytic murein transglycosylase-like protein
MIACESEGNVRALNHNKNGSHDKGLMQINSCNFDWLRKELGITDFYDPRQNIQCGCYILGLLSQKYTNVHRALMSYNMGERRTRKLWNKGIRSSRYSRRVMENYRKKGL